MADPFILVGSAIYLVAVLYPSPLWFIFIHRISAPLSLMIWLIILNFITFLNAIIWSDTSVIEGAFWCDISSKAVLIGPIGLSASIFAIAYYIARTMRSTGKFGGSEQKPFKILDYVISFVLPIVVGGLSFIYQPARFAVARNIGCQPSITVSTPMILLYLLVAPLLSFLTLLMSGYIGFQLISKRRHIARLARPAEKTFSAHWFVRLGALSALLGPVCFAFAIWVSVDIFAIYGPFEKFDWDAIHEGTTEDIRQFPNTTHANAFGWFPVVVGILTILVLGPGAEVGEHLKKIAVWLKLDTFFDYTDRLSRRISRRITGHSFWNHAGSDHIPPEMKTWYADDREDQQSFISKSPYEASVPVLDYKKHTSRFENPYQDQNDAQSEAATQANSFHPARTRLHREETESLLSGTSTPPKGSPPSTRQNSFRNERPMRPPRTESDFSIPVTRPPRIDSRPPRPQRTDSDFSERPQPQRSKSDSSRRPERSDYAQSPSRSKTSPSRPSRSDRSPITPRQYPDASQSPISPRRQKLGTLREETRADREQTRANWDQSKYDLQPKRPTPARTHSARRNVPSTISSVAPSSILKRRDHDNDHAEAASEWIRLYASEETASTDRGSVIRFV